MECGTKPVAEKPSSELEKQIAVSVWKGFREAKRSGFLSFSCAGRSESSDPNVSRCEEIADMKVEAWDRPYNTPPPIYFSIEHAQELPASWRGLSCFSWF